MTTTKTALTLEVAKTLKPGTKLVLLANTRPFVAEAGASCEVGPRQVYRISFGTAVLDIKWTDHAKAFHQNNGGYLPEDFALAEEAPAEEPKVNHPFAIGSRVKVVGFKGSDLHGREGKVIAYNKDFAYPIEVLLDGDEGSSGAYGHHEVELLTPKRLTPQAAHVLQMMKDTGRVTAVQAWNVLKVRSLPRRIRDIKEAGYRVFTEFKKDHTGQRYAEYTLA